jgi:phosphoenolpyruvate-protein kinase (PTS system EI component)
MAEGELYLPDRRLARVGGGTVSDGTVVDGTVVDGTVVDGTVIDGTASDGAASDGAASDGTRADQALTVTASDVRAAFAAVAADRGELAAKLRAASRADEASIVEIGGLIAADSALSAPVLAAFGAVPAAPSGEQHGALAPAQPGTTQPGTTQPGTTQPRLTMSAAAAAVTKAAEEQAALLEALADPDLAQRAGDVRQVGQAVIARLTGAAAPAPPDASFILVRREVDPVDIIRLTDGGNLVGAVSLAGGASSHAAIVARGLGLPMLVGIDPALLSALVPGALVPGDPAPGALVPGDPETGDPETGDPGPGDPAPGDQVTGTGSACPRAILDATAGELRTDPSPADLARVRAAESDASTAWSSPGQVRTVDRELVTVLCNVASAAETRLGLAGGAGGVGLLRTEIPFTRARAWPSRADHLAALSPVLAQLAGRRAVVRLLDFAGDKIPPFPGAEGLAAFLGAPHALDDQLAAILAAGVGTDLAIMIPMVRSLDEVRLVRGRLATAAKAASVAAPPLGMMVEVAATATAAAAFAPHVDFFSIGTNDLTADVLRRDRAALSPADAAAPPVLAAIAGVVAAARQAGIGVSVCGDAAADQAVLPLLLALGVRTISVGAARVSQAAKWIAPIDTGSVVIPHAS